MKYDPKLWHKKKPAVLHEGKLSCLEFRIVNLGAFPCAYIGLDPKEERVKRFVKDIKKQEHGYDTLDFPVHGGVTFFDEGNDIQISKDTFWIGWDYAHMGDYINFGLRDIPAVIGWPKELPCKKWTTEEMYDEVAQVIPLVLEKLREYEKV